MKPVVTIITATYNASQYIERTIRSVAQQSYGNIEYIIVDGGSTDSTMAIVEANKKFVSKYCSEKDNGIYDAWNKGVRMATGDWVAFIGAGDEYYPDAISEYIKFIEEADTDLHYISSQVDIVDEYGKFLFAKGSAWEWPKFMRFMNIAHVGSFHSRELFSIYGLFDSSYKIAGDYELLMRPKAELKAGFFQKKTAKMLFGGVSASSKILKENRKIKIHLCNQSKFTADVEFLIGLIKLKIKAVLSRRGLYINLKN